MKKLDRGSHAGGHTPARNSPDVAPFPQCAGRRASIGQQGFHSVIGIWSVFSKSRGTSHCGLRGTEVRRYQASDLRASAFREGGRPTGIVEPQLLVNTPSIDAWSTGLEDPCLILLVCQPEHNAALFNFDGQLERLPGRVVDQAVATSGGLPDIGDIAENHALLRRLPSLCGEVAMPAARAQEHHVNVVFACASLMPW